MKMRIKMDYNELLNKVSKALHSSKSRYVKEWGNLIYNGYCRMGIGFSNWKHILLAVKSSSAVTNATDLALA